MAGTLTISGMASGLLAGSKTIGPLTMTGAATVGTILDLALGVGDTTVTVPTGATAVLIALPANNAVLVRARTNLNPSDTGLPLGPAGWAVLPLTGVTQLIFNAAAATSGLELTFI